MKDKKDAIIKALEANGGIVTDAAGTAGVSKSTYYNWIKADDAFRAKCVEAIKTGIDIRRIEDRDKAIKERERRLKDREAARDALMKKVEQGDTTAIIFAYKMLWLVDVPETKSADLAVEENQSKGEQAGDMSEMEKKIKNQHDRIVKLLKSEGKYSKELTYQVDIAAQLIVRTRMLKQIIFSGKHSPVKVEISREGNRRESKSEIEKIYEQYTIRLQRSLQALGMNFDAKDRKTDDDGFNDFMKKFESDD